MKYKNIVSVIIPCTDRVIGFKECLKSVLTQKCNIEIEVIIVENNSTDRSLVPQIINNINDSRIKHIYLNSCKNANVARNSGAEIAQGAFLAFLDSDDRWLSSHISSCLLEIGESNGLFGSFYSIKGRKRSLVSGIYTGEIAIDLFVNKTIDIRTSTLFFKKEFFDATKFDEKLFKHQDWGLAIDFTHFHTLKFKKEPSVEIIADASGRMSNKTNPKASRYFAFNKLSKNVQSHFLLSRMKDELYIGTREELTNYIIDFENIYFQSSLRDKGWITVLKISSTNNLLFSSIRTLLGMLKHITVKNK